jgi:hypothetical protein
MGEFGELTGPGTQCLPRRLRERGFVFTEPIAGHDIQYGDDLAIATFHLDPCQRGKALRAAHQAALAQVQDGLPVRIDTGTPHWKSDARLCEVMDWAGRVH